MTGGSRGIGRAVSEALSAAGARVAVNYRSDEASANGLVRELRAAGGEAMALAGDVSDPSESRQLVRDVVVTVAVEVVLQASLGWRVQWRLRRPFAVEAFPRGAVSVTTRTAAVGGVSFGSVTGRSDAWRL